MTALKERWRRPKGKFSVGAVVNHSRNSLLGFSMFSSVFSSVLSHFHSRWQFCNITQCPFSLPLFTRSTAGPSCPCPSDSGLNLFDGMCMSLASFCRSVNGSAPGDRMKMMGLLQLDWRYTLAVFSTGGVM